MGRAHSCCTCNDARDGDAAVKIQAGAELPCQASIHPPPESCLSKTQLGSNVFTAVEQAAEQSEEESEGQDDEEFEKQMEITLQRRASQTRREAVSSESVKVDPDFKPPVYPKTSEQEARISSALGKCFLFASLGAGDLRALIAAFRETPVSAGTGVIQKGATVGMSEPALFILDSGRLDVFVDGDQPVFTYTERGQYFGELALMYNAPRAATIVATQDSMLWSIDRATFTVLVKEVAQKAQCQRTAVLRSVDIMKNLSQEEISALCDAIVIRQYEKGDLVIHEGDLGHECFIVQEGKLGAQKGGVTVRTYGPSEYFGELALLLDAPRAASVIALEPCVMLVLGAKEFNNMLKVGPVHQALKERAQSYGYRF